MQSTVVIISKETMATCLDRVGRRRQSGEFCPWLEQRADEAVVIEKGQAESSLRRNAQPVGEIGRAHSEQLEGVEWDFEHES